MSREAQSAKRRAQSRKIAHPDPACPLYTALHQAATGGLRQRALSESESAWLVAETEYLAEMAEPVRAARREREARP